MIFNLEDLRATAPAELRELADDELILEYAKRTGNDPVQVARVLGYGNSGGKTANLIGGGIDDYQASLYGLGAAVARKVGLDGTAAWMERQRERNELNAQTSFERAQDLGAVLDWRDVDGIGSGLNYVAGLTARSLPYLAEAAAGGIYARGLMTGATTALKTAKTAEEAARAARTLRLGTSAGAVAASYPSSVASVLEAQRDAGAKPGEEDLGSAAAGGVPYALLNAFGVEGLVARGIRPAASSTKASSALSRIAGTGAKTALSEGVSETGQAGIEQYYGRMAFDENETLFNDEAKERYLDAFIGGAVLGKTFGAVAGLRRPIDDFVNYDLTKRGSIQELSSISDKYDKFFASNESAYAKDVESVDAELSDLSETPNAGRSRVFSDIEKALIDAGIKPHGKKAEEQFALYKAAQQEGFLPGAADLVLSALRSNRLGIARKVVNMASEAMRYNISDEDMQPVYTLLAENKVKNAQRELAGLIAERQASAQTEQTPVTSSDGDAIAVSSPTPSDVDGVGLSTPTIYESETSQTEQAETQESPTTSLQPATAAGDTPAGAAAVPVETARVAQASDDVYSSGAAETFADAPLVGATETAAGVSSAARATAVDDGYTSDAEAWSDFAPESGPTYDQLPPSLQEMWKLARARGQMSIDLANKIAEEYTASETSEVASEAVELLNKAFGTRDTSIMLDSLVNGMTQEQIAQKYGVSRALVEKLVGTGKDAAARRMKRVMRAAKKYGWNVSEVLAKLNQFTTTAPRRAASLEAAEETYDLGPSDLEGFEIVSSAGGSSSSWMDGGDNPENMSVRDRASYYSQKAADALEKANKLEQLVAEAEQEGRDFIPSSKGKVSLEEAKKNAAELSAYADKQLEKAAVLLEQAKREQVSLKDNPGQRLWDALDESFPDTFVPYSALDAEQRGLLDKVAADYKTLDAAMNNSREFAALLNETRLPDDFDNQETDDDFFNARYGKDRAASDTYTAEELVQEIKSFVRADIPGRKLVVVNSVGELLQSSDPDAKAVGAAIDKAGAFGVAVDGRAYLVADRIKKGQGRAKFMHEVGAHLGLENLLPNKTYNRLVEQVVQWAKSDKDTLESRLARKAAERVMDANTEAKNRRAELLAYFIEESVQAGIDPTAETMRANAALREWFRTLWAAFKMALRKLGVKPESLTAKDVVNLAFGAARLEITGTWHGTAAQFRKFDSKYIGSGTGAQVFGWGTYLAQNEAEARKYYNRQTQAKTKPARFYTVDGTPISNSILEADLEQRLAKAGEITKDTLIELERAYTAKLAELSKAPENNSALTRVLRGALVNLKQAIESGGVRYQKANKPDGSLMRVDASVEQSDMLDWNAPLGAQKNVYAKLEKNLSPAIRKLIEEKANAKLSDIEGDDFYRLLQSIQYENGAIAEQFDAEYRARNLDGASDKKVVSLYLDEKLGIPGVVFGEDDTNGRNLVVFNDKNLYRVGSQITADRERMKFGKDPLSVAPTRSTIERNIAKLPENMRAPVRNVILGVNDVATKVLDRVVFTHTLVDRALKAGIGSAKRYAALQLEMSTKARKLERDVEKIAEMYTFIEERDKGNHPRSLNQFLFESTRQGKWGYGEKRDPEFGAWFDSLGPNSQKLVRAIFEHGDNILRLKKKAVIDWANSEYDDQIESAKKAVAAAVTEQDRKRAKKLLAELITDKADSLKKFEGLFKIAEGKPYAPIKRFGDYVVVAKSAEFRQAEEAGDTAKLKELMADEAHYHVSFTETKNEARRLADQLRELGFYGDGEDAVTFFEREENEAELFGGQSVFTAVTKLRGRVDDISGEAAVKAQLQRMVTDLWLTTLAETSARKSEMRRKGVYGEVDMLRSFANQGRADARFIAAVEYNPQIEDAIRAMRQEVKRGGNRDRKSEIFNELMDRYAKVLDVSRSPSVDKLTRLSSVYFLATSPAYYLQNLTQPWLMSLPVMAGLHGYGKASAALFKAYSELSPLVKTGKLFETAFDYAKVPPEVRDAIQELVNRGRIDIGLDTELGEFRIDGSNKFADAWNKVDKGLRLLVQKTEAINRLSTAIAAYRLELARTGSSEAALDYADKILLDTHGDYSRFNAPKYFNTALGRLALQFQKFLLIQLTFYFDLVKRAFTDPAERRLALRVLGFSLGHTAFLAGAMGLPGYTAISTALGALLSDDEDKFDLTYELRKLIGNEEMANLILRGTPTLVGADISGRVGAGNMFSIMPFSNADLSSPRGQAEALGTLLGGASLGMAIRIADGLGLMLSGDWVRGAERVLPKGLGDAIKAYRESVDGMTLRNGDVILPESEIDAIETFLTAIGITPVQTSLVYERRKRVADMDKNFQERAAKIKSAYVKAYKNRDAEGMKEAREMWVKLQEVRRRSGYRVQPVSELLKAPQAQAKRERNTIGGVQTSGSNRAFAKEQAEL